MIGTEVRLVAESSSPMYPIAVESSVAVRALWPAVTGSERLSLRPATMVTPISRCRYSAIPSGPGCGATSEWVTVPPQQIASTKSM